MNGKLLRSIMVLHGDTNATLADFLGITEQSVSNRQYFFCGLSV